MATWIPVLGTCAARTTAEERRLAERLEQKLEDEYLPGWGMHGSASPCCTTHKRAFTLEHLCLDTVLERLTRPSEAVLASAVSQAVRVVRQDAATTPEGSCQPLLEPPASACRRAQAAKAGGLLMH
ncbi:hypothetical protein APS58_1651 [Paracidovorax citrulli]|nr:hypothetical protein CQB05_21725 [Paracidovorax citrulli]QCX10516.1 hypothetical protein APS58_1651 [Paracidovorax citrulli]